MANILAITVDNFHLIPESIRKCNLWEITEAESDADPIFDKELWAFDIIMTWGTCCLAYVENDIIIAVAFYAPPSCFPYQSNLKSAPVSPDAILLACIRFADLYCEQNRGRIALIEEELILGVIKQASSRGIRAIESFATVSETYEHKTCRCQRPCFIKDTTLETMGFYIIQHDVRYPRYRINVNEGLEWKLAVESALDQLLVEAEYDGPRKLAFV